MKNPKLNYLIVGSFVIAVMAGLIAAIALLAGRTGATDRYFAVYDNVAGVEFGTRVLYEGYHIGQVEEVTPITEDGKLRFKVELDVSEGWKIPKDSVAEIASSGLLAAVTINLRAGDSREALAPGAQIAAEGAANLMASVNELARDIRRLTESDVKPMIAKITAVLGGVGDMIDSDAEGTGDVRTVVEKVAAAAPEILDNVNTFTVRLNETADQIDRLLAENNVTAINDTIRDFSESAHNMNELTVQLNSTRVTVDALLADMNGMMTNINTMVRDNRLDVDRSIIELRHTVETVARHIEAINQNLEGTSRNMYEFSRQIRQNPGLLLGGTPPADNAQDN